MKQKAEKNNRFEESRYFETREAEEFDEVYQNIQMAWNDPFYIDPSMVPEGMVYSFKREFFHKAGGMEDKGRIAECLRKGWKPVPAEKHPYLASFGIDGLMTHKNGYIERGGQILMERPKKYNDYEMNILMKTTYDQIHSNEALRGSNREMDVRRNSIGYGGLGSY